MSQRKSTLHWVPTRGEMVVTGEQKITTTHRILLEVAELVNRVRALGRAYGAVIRRAHDVPRAREHEARGRDPLRALARLAQVVAHVERAEEGVGVH